MVASSTWTISGIRSLCATQSRASTTTLTFHRCSEGHASTGLCSVLPRTRVTCTAAATVVLICLIGNEEFKPIACVYSSETGVWGNIIAAADRCWLHDSNPGLLIGNILYWSSRSVSTDRYIVDMDYFTQDILEFDLDRQSLAVTKGPPCLNGSIVHQIIQAEDDAVGLLIYLHGRFKVWQRKVNCHGGTAWLLQKTFQVHNVLGLPSQIGSATEMEILGYDEDNGALFLLVSSSVYMVQLMSMQFRKLDGCLHASKCHPFTSFCAPGIAIHD